MLNKLQWQFQNNRLTLQGVLDCTTLLTLWQQRHLLLTDDRLIIDVSQLSRIDSAGLAALVQLVHAATQREMTFKLAGVTNGLMSLIVVYNLLPMLTPYLESPEKQTT